MKLTPDQIGKALRIQKHEWIDAQLRKVIPPRLWRATKHPATREQAKARIMEMGYNVQYEKTGEVLFRKGDRVLAQCKVVLDLEKPEDLLALTSAMRK